MLVPWNPLEQGSTVTSFQLRTRNSIKGFVRPSIGPSAQIKKWENEIFGSFLVADMQLYNYSIRGSVRPSIHWSVGPSVHQRFVYFLCKFV